MRNLKPFLIACALLPAACAGGGTASSSLPQNAADSGVRSSAAARLLRGPDGDLHPAAVSAPACSASGYGSFLGGTTSADVAAGQDSAVVDGQGNQACDQVSTIAGGYQNTISSSDDQAGYSFIGAGANNVITGPGGVSAIVSGGENSLTAEYAFIGGGQSNAISGTEPYAVITGGYANTASAEWATVAGGNTNTASGNAANVAGGAHNTASGPHATVLGGSQNTASGAQSLAAGYNSNAATAGSFVWSDDSGSTGLTSTVANQFLLRASGGFTLWTNAAGTVGATLAPGSGAWSSASDRNMKTDIVPLDDAEVLDRVGRLPVSRWSYISEHGVRHVGPMAQDFYAAFGVGEDDRHITSIDEDGVALAAIKALRTQNEDLRAELRAHQAATDRKIAALTAAFRLLKDSVTQRTIRR
jgi:hypothetical protein